MQLSGLPGVSLLSVLFRPAAEPGKPAEAPLADAAEATVAPQVSTEALSAIAAQYDVAQLTPRDLTRMIEELRTAGVLRAEDLQALTQLRATFDRAGLDPDEPLDVLALLRGGVEAERTTARHETPEPSAAERQLAWMERLALVQRGGDLAELDAVA